MEMAFIKDFLENWSLFSLHCELVPSLQSWCHKAVLHQQLELALEICKLEEQEPGVNTSGIIDVRGRWSERRLMVLDVRLRHVMFSGALAANSAWRHGNSISEKLKSVPSPIGYKNMCMYMVEQRSCAAVHINQKMFVDKI